MHTLESLMAQARYYAEVCLSMGMVPHHDSLHQGKTYEELQAALSEVLAERLSALVDHKVALGKEWMDKYLDLLAPGAAPKGEQLTVPEIEAKYAAQAAPKLSKFKLLAITTAYEQGVGKGRQGTDFNPYTEGTDEREAWRLGYQEGAGMAAQAKPKEQTPEAKRIQSIFDATKDAVEGTKTLASGAAPKGEQT